MPFDLVEGRAPLSHPHPPHTHHHHPPTSSIGSSPEGCMGYTWKMSRCPRPRWSVSFLPSDQLSPPPPTACRSKAVLYSQSSLVLNAFEIFLMRGCNPAKPPPSLLSPLTHTHRFPLLLLFYLFTPHPAPTPPPLRNKKCVNFL